MVNSCILKNYRLLALCVSPDWFRLHSIQWYGAQQIGNSVPPPLARVIAAEIIKVLGSIPTRPEPVYGLGDRESFTPSSMGINSRQWVTGLS